MAEDSTNKQAGLQPDSDAIIPRISLGEQGYSGLKITGKQILEEANRAFLYPSFLKVVNEMKLNPTVAAGLGVYKVLLSRVPWKVEPPEGATEQQKARAKFVLECIDDMDISWGNVLNNILTYMEYGHSVQEKVFRRRLRKNGSKYNDGLVGLKKLGHRGQDTLRYWYFSDDGRDLKAIGQSTDNLVNSNKYINLPTNEDGVIEISRNKFLLFTADTTKDNPQGNSVLKPIYLAYKRLEMLQDQECLGVAKDIAGIPVIRLHPKYMDPNASTSDKAVYDMCKKIVDSISQGKQSGMVFPTMPDPETKVDLFDVSLLERKGTPFFDLDSIIRRYQNDILVGLFADVIKMGDGQGGSLALADNKTNLLSLSISHRLKEIAEVLNTDLIPQLFALNGWTDTELPKFVPGDIENVDMDSFSSFIQRVAAVGLLELDRDVLNKVREVGGIKPKPEDEPVDYDNLSTNVSNSRSGDGMAAGTTGNGTAKVGGKASGRDNSVANKENKG